MDFDDAFSAIERLAGRHHLLAGRGYESTEGIPPDSNLGAGEIRDVRKLRGPAFVNDNRVWRRSWQARMGMRDRPTAITDGDTVGANGQAIPTVAVDTPVPSLTLGQPFSGDAGPTGALLEIVDQAASSSSYNRIKYSQDKWLRRPANRRPQYGAQHGNGIRRSRCLCRHSRSRIRASST